MWSNGWTDGRTVRQTDDSYERMSRNSSWWSVLVSGESFCFHLVVVCFYFYSFPFVSDMFLLGGSDGGSGCSYYYFTKIYNNWFWLCSAVSPASVYYFLCDLHVFKSLIKNLCKRTEVHEELITFKI